MAEKIQVAVIGAGPAGLFAAEKLASLGYGVALFNRDVKPGGMAEYGIYPDKHAVKDGLRKQFNHILSCDQIHYYGNICVGEGRSLSIPDLLDWGFPAVLVARASSRLASARSLVTRAASPMPAAALARPR